MYPCITVCHCGFPCSVNLVDCPLQTVLGTIHPFYLLSSWPIIFSQTCTIIKQLSRVSWSLELFRNVYSVLVLWSRCLLVSSCLRTELLCFSPGLIRLTGPEPGLPASLLAAGLAWQSKLLRYRHVSLMSVLLLLSHAFLASDAVDFYPQYTFIFIFWNLLALVGRCSN